MKETRITDWKECNIELPDKFNSEGAAMMAALFVFLKEKHFKIEKATFKLDFEDRGAPQHTVQYRINGMDIISQLKRIDNA
jgi:hypothetical protein